MRIKELMTAEVAHVEPQNTVHEVVTCMREHAYSCLVVTRDNIPVGIVTERDVVRVYNDQSQCADLLDRRVEEVMSAPPVVLNDTATLDEAMALTEARRIRHLPVVDENAQLAGIVTHTDLARSYRQVIEQQVSERTQQLVAANEQLTEQQALLHAEEAIAKQVFDQLTVRDALDDQGLSVWNEPFGTFSGDLLLVGAPRESSRHVLLGDFTGHGLSAALGAVPTASIFHTMTDKGLGMRAIEAELNNKLTTLLPVGYFCCVCLLEVDMQQSLLHICNRGLPPVYLLGTDGSVKGRFRSSGVPLGITASVKAAANWESIPLTAGDRIYACSDGLTELKNAAGEEFGTARLERSLVAAGARNGLEQLRDAARVFLGAAQADDDITVIELSASV
jgi:CBS domain-containing protein